MKAHNNALKTCLLQEWGNCLANLWSYVHRSSPESGPMGRRSKTVPALRKSTLGEINTPLSLLNEKKRIASILGKADVIRRKRQQAIQPVDEFLRAVFLNIFGDLVTNAKGFGKASITELADEIAELAFKSD